MNGLKPRCKLCCNIYDNAFYPTIRTKKLAREASKYVKRIRVNKYTDIELKAIIQCRRMIHRLIVKKNGKKTRELLGYNYKDLLQHLGRWPEKHEAIDHKIPLTWFIDYSNYKVIHSLSNLQILTKSENSKKLNKYSHPVSFEYFEMVKDKLKPQYINKITHYGK